MQTLKIFPSQLSGEIIVPPSKVILHRALVCAAMSTGVSNIKNILFSHDALAMIGAVEALGADITKNDDSITVKGIFAEDNKIKMKKNRTIDCIESVDTLLLTIPLSLVFGGKTKFIGEKDLTRVPLDEYFKIFDEENISHKDGNEILNLELSGTLCNGEYSLKGNTASQFLNGLLLALPLANGDSKISITGNLDLKSDVDMTLDIMSHFGIKISNDDNTRYNIWGNQKYKPNDLTIEGDHTYAGFLFACGALGSNINVIGLEDASIQPDKEIINILMKMGAKMIRGRSGIKIKANANELNRTTIDAGQCPDFFPIYTIISALSVGGAEIVNIGRLKLKEGAMVENTISELLKLGIQISEKDDSIVISGTSKLNGGVEVWSHRDYRIAMAMVVAATRCESAIVLRDCDCISAIYPDLFNDLKELGGKFDELIDKDNS